MTNIWGFISQTIYVSSMAVLILFIKWLMKDKLPARWQYGIWTTLVLCAFIPVGGIGGYIMPPLHIFLETIKHVTETGLNSAFSSADVPISNFHTIPYVTAAPDSITDIVFIIYVLGIIISISKYIHQYIKLGRLIDSADDADPDIQISVENVSKKYNLSACRIKVIPGLPSAFVFGLTKPVLVLSADDKTDDKIILHELLHLKYKDQWQNVLWAFLKAVHWPNPFLKYVFRTISNDMESLCDYRVMELLKGRRRRDYGRILLSMTNEKYPAAFGTTSISNGSHFISERIQAIARFKLYPKGMETVSMCIITLLIPLAITGSEMKNFPQGSYYKNTDRFTSRYQQARARMTGCKTVAGAIDTYAKALLTGNELYYLAVEPVEIAKTKYSLPKRMDYSSSSQLYKVANLEKINKDTYAANLMFEDRKTELDGKVGTNTFLIPIKIIRQHGWKVIQTGDYTNDIVLLTDAEKPMQVIPVDGYALPLLYTTETHGGELEICMHRYAEVNNRISSSDDFFASLMNVYNFDLYPRPHTDFDNEYENVEVFFHVAKKYQGVKTVSVGISAMDDINKADKILDESGNLISGQHSVSKMFTSSTYGTDRTATGEVLYENFEEHFHPDEHSQAYSVAVWLGNTLIEHIVIDAETGNVYEKNI